MQASTPAVTAAPYPRLVTTAYGLDIETDTRCGGLDPRTCSVLAVAVVGPDSSHVLRGPERALLGRLDRLLADLAPGVVVTWNGSAFDLPFLHDRAKRAGVDLGLRLQLDPAIQRSHPPLPGHDGFYRASWYGHAHLDAYLGYRGLTTEGEGSLALKAVAARHGLEVVEVDASRVHELDSTELERYVLSDARLARRLATDRWRELEPFCDLVGQP